MAKTFSLRTLLELAERKSSDAAMRLGGLQAQMSHTESKLNLLLDYREEYRARFRAALNKDFDANSLQNFHHFMAKLDQAIDQQRNAVEQSRELTQAGRREWQHRQYRLKAFDTLAQRHASTEARRISRSDQREADEVTARSATQRAKAR